MNDMDDIIPGERPEYNTLAKQLAAVQRDSGYIQFIKNPSEQVQLAAVSQNIFAIEHIENPSEQVQLAAVQKDGWAIRFILAKGITPSIPVQRAAVLQNLVDVLKVMFKRNFPISKMIQWTAAKRIKELGLSYRLDDEHLYYLDLDVQNFLRDE